MIRRTRKTGGIPVLKLPPARLDAVVVALREHEYNRDGFREAVMAVFADSTKKEKGEKSVFRGMAIPTLRALGLLRGFEFELQLSSDGALVAAGADHRSSAPMATILNEIELELQLGAVWAGRVRDATVVLDGLCLLDSRDGAYTNETRRRAARWLAYLEHFGVIKRKADVYSRARPVASNLPSSRIFAKRLLAAYRLLTPRTIGEPAVEIDTVSRTIALECFRESVVVTRRRFDGLLRDCLTRDNVDVHLHHSMGAGQRLFLWRGEPYESLSIRSKSDG